MIVMKENQPTVMSGHAVHIYGHHIFVYNLLIMLVAFCWLYL